jgi:eukaryotic-like serine/threonine-protein kinase
MRPGAKEASMIGRVIGHFQLREKIGAGAMGEVYLAWDSRLRRPVALKILPPATIANLVARKRLQREALALSRLNHPCVATLYDFVEEPDLDGLIMEFVSGESLDHIVARGALDETTLLDYAVQIADGLAAAHDAGVVHRDIKPGNIRITSRGKVKLLDFGLAQLLHGTAASAASSDSAQGMIAGTIAYIAPEVWGGAPATAASDLYSVGVVLHEMATGVRPFAGLAGQALVHATKCLDAGPVRDRNPAITPELDAVIARLMSKRPEDRFASARDLHQALDALHAARRSGRLAPAFAARAALRQWAVPVAVLVVGTAALLWGTSGLRRPGPRRASVVAILPFSDPYGDSSSTYFADGVTHDLTVALAEYDSLQVIAPTSMTSYRHDGRRPSEIALEIHADRVVDGSLQRRGRRLGLSVQLIDGATNRILKSRRYDSSPDEVLGLVDRIAADLAGWMKAGPSTGRGPAELRVDPVAYDLFQRGRFHLDRRSPDGIRQALAHFRRSIDRDSTFAPAWSGLADAWSASAYSGLERPLAAFPQARLAARRALALDPQLADGYVSLGNVLQNHDWDWEGAADSYRKALALNPNHAVAHHWYASNLALRGRFDQAAIEIEPARRLDPNSIAIATAPAVFLYFARRYDDALAALEPAFALDSTSGLVQRARAAILDRLGREDQAMRSVCRWLDGQQLGQVSAAVAHAYAAQGVGAGLHVLVAALERKRAAGRYEPATHLAEIYARLGERESAFRWLAIALQEKDTELNRLGVDPIFDPLRGDPRFAALLQDVGLGSAPASVHPEPPAPRGSTVKGGTG